MLHRKQTNTHISNVTKEALKLSVSQINLIFLSCWFERTHHLLVLFRTKTASLV